MKRSRRSHSSKFKARVALEDVSEFAARRGGLGAIDLQGLRSRSA